MVRAGVVRHPSAYGISGYNEIQTPPKRYSIINQQALNNLFCTQDENHFRQMHQEWVDLELKNDESKRQSFWSESVAVGDECFIQNIQQELSGRIPGRSIVSENGTTSLQEPQSSCSILFGGQKVLLSTENTYLLHLNDMCYHGPTPHSSTQPHSKSTKLD
jgi:putative transposase